MERRPIVRGIIELVGWCAVAGVGLVMITQATGWNGSRLVATLQSLTPYGIPLVLAVAAIAVQQRREVLAATGALVGLGAFVLSVPLVIPPSQPSPAENAEGIRVASVNLLFSNPVVDDAADALFQIDPDVIVFSEYTRPHHDRLSAHRLADRYDHRLSRNGPLTGGMAVWSKFPLDADDDVTPIGRTVDAIVDGPDGPFHLLGVHPSTPIADFDRWEHDLELIGSRAAASSLPTLVIGDFNASYWHPLLRDILRQGFSDAHIAHGSGWSTSWPTDKFFPPFVRLDHALTGNGLVSTEVDDFHVPGSDHTAFVVTVMPSG